MIQYQNKKRPCKVLDLSHIEEKHNHHKRWRDEVHAKYAQMTNEEKQKLRDEQSLRYVGKAREEHAELVREKMKRLGY